MRVALLFLLLSFISASHAQNYSNVDELIDQYPRDFTDTATLAAMINKDFPKADEKVRAIFRWVSTNIDYDVQTAENMNRTAVKAFSYTTEKEMLAKEKQFKSDLVSQTLKSRRAVCHGYAALVEDLCIKSDLEAKTITGDLKSDPSQIGQLPENNHAWNVVKIGNDWKFLDATLAAGFINSANEFELYFNDAYFFTNPDAFFLNHFPLEEKWLLTPKTKKDYTQLPVFFSFYLKAHFKILAPKSGIQSIPSGDFKLIFEGLEPIDEVSYMFENEGKRVYVEQENKASAFSIPLNKPDNLYLFVNGKIMAIYKIIN